MDKILVIFALLTGLAAAVWIFSRRRDAVDPLVNEDAPNLQRAGIPGTAPVSGKAPTGGRRTASRLTRFDTGPATPADVDFTPSPELYASPEPALFEPSSHTHQQGAPICAEVPLSVHGAHQDTSSFDSCSTDLSSGGGFDGGGHHH